MAKIPEEGAMYGNERDDPQHKGPVQRTCTGILENNYYY